MKEWKLTYTVLYAWEKEPTEYIAYFMFLETVIYFINETEKDTNQKLLSFNVQRLK